MRGNAGLFYPSSRKIEINQELIPKQKELTLWHETGHLLDDISAGKKGMSVKGLEQELEDVYSTLNTGKEQASPRILPRDQGYSRSEAPYEYIAEALRAYMTNPNYFKAVAPNAAAAIRALVNSHPQLSKLVQFNSLAGLAALGGALGTTNDDERNL